MRLTAPVAIAVAMATAFAGVLALEVPAGAAGNSNGVTTRRDVTFRKVDGEDLKLDVYQPSKKGDHRPAIVVVHGGGWSQGDKSAFADEATKLAQAGFVAFSVNYRLAPQHPYPAALDDVQAAVKWVRKHANGYGVDAKRIGALGGSAGAHLVGLLGTVGEGALDRGARVAAVVSWSGPMDLVPSATVHNAGQESFGGNRIPSFLGCADGPCDLSKAKDASPIDHVEKTDAPMLLVNSSMELVPQQQADRMKAALDAVGVVDQEIILPGKAHSRAYAGKVWGQTVAFFRDHLR